jgi:hypothetical protein
MNTAKGKGRGNKFPKALSKASVCNSDAIAERKTFFRHVDDLSLLEFQWPYVFEPTIDNSAWYVWHEVAKCYIYSYIFIAGRDSPLIQLLLSFHFPSLLKALAISLTLSGFRFSTLLFAYF